MPNKASAEKMTDVMTAFIKHTSKRLPDDVLAKLEELRSKEDAPTALQIYELMFRNLELASELDRPICQDTGIMQFHISCGSDFPLLGELEEILTDALIRATEEMPLRQNAVETFDETNTGTNTGSGVPVIWWDIVPNSDKCEICTYMAGGGCSLPGHADVLMPSQGYKAVCEFVLDRVTKLGPNACPPLLVGVGIANSVETAAVNAKKALFRPVGSRNENEKAAAMEELLEDSINKIGIGPQGLGGRYSVTGVNIVNTARHPASMGVAVTVGCWVHRRGTISFDSNIGFESGTHSGFEKEYR